ncbi:MAG TPA: DUF2203 family protein [Anaerolineae bacterium]|nr:DUF2203 family protein [Anaerolineae bacterium]HIP72441.1 DUF2203 family protein [Anaerolineae bacterium]
MSEPRYFTVAEANALLPTLKPLLSKLLQRRALVSISAQNSGSQLHETYANIGGPEISAMTQDFIAIQILIDKILSYGCILKDLNGGLIDFLSERDGRIVYLCWKYDEPEVQYYHELNAGFGGREPL